MKDIKDYIHLYLKCEVQVVGISKLFQPHCGWKIGDVFVMSPIVLHLALCEDLSVKPILRKLDSMTEDEQQEVLSLTYDNKGKKFTEAEIAVLLFNPTTWTPDAFRYLLSNGFDLFNLIEEGLAIDRSTLTH